MDAVEVDAGAEQIGVARQAESGEQPAVGAAPEADAMRVHLRLLLQEVGARHHVAVLRRAAPGAVRRLAEGAPVHDAEAVVDRQHGIAAAGEVLIHCVGVVVVLHVMEPKQHLPDRSAVGEDQARQGVAAARAAGG